ncbi:MAG TPA: Gfo/Idh/MocA family oxidoreductase [Planctomycetaceae bacterium]|nr:Gfo/Idh/MocA family oxidoreductase [Planctomycetaceae bacterium]
MSDASSKPATKLRLALIGCGRIGRLHAERVAADGRAVLTALLDPDPTAAKSLCSEVAEAAVVYPTFESLVEGAEFDAAVVASPTHLHFEQASALLDRKTPVLCEKPLARTRGEILVLIERSQKSQVPLSVAYQRRTWATYRALRRLVRSGEFGPVRAVASHNVENWQSTIVGTWRDDPQMNPDGFIGDAGSHKIDAVFYVTGLEPLDVFARCDRCGSRVEITASVSAMLTGGVPLSMDFVGHGQHLGELLSIHCAHADLTLRDGELWLAREERSERVPITETDSNPISAFLDTILQGAENFAPPDCALPVYDFTRSLLDSSRSRCAVSLQSPTPMGPLPKPE